MLRDIREIVNGSVCLVDSQSSVLSRQSSEKAQNCPGTNRDLRVADEFKIFTNVNCTVVDPKNFDERSFVTVSSECAIVPPNSFALARSVDYFKIPRDTLTICVGKSTYARCGIIVNVTPFAPEWE